MENNNDINFKKSFNEKLKEEKINKPFNYVRIYKSSKIKGKTKENKYDKNSFRKKYKNDKIKDPVINRTLNDIYNTIKSINKINEKISTIFYKRKNTNENNNTSEIIQNKFIENKKLNEFSKINNSYIKNDKKNLIRQNYSYDNIITRNSDFSILNNKDNSNSQIKTYHLNNKTESNQFFYISQYAPKLFNNINEINNKLNYDYNDSHLAEKLNKYKNKLIRRNKTYGNILDLNYFRNSKNIKDIILLEKDKQKEFKKLENIKKIKNQKFIFNNRIYNSIRFRTPNHNNNNNKNAIRNKPFCFNDDITISKDNSNYSHNIVKNNNSNYYINKFFQINYENDKHKYNTDYRNYRANITNKLNFNYKIYKNILNFN